MDWQVELVAIPPPPFGEQARTAWIAGRFAQAGLAHVRTDEIATFSAFLPKPTRRRKHGLDCGSFCPRSIPSFRRHAPRPLVNGDRLEAPGACDNAAGVIGMLAIAHALLHAKFEAPVSLLFLANVGEEGEGDLRGVRHLYKEEALAGRYCRTRVLDGAGAESAVTQALGSKRYQVVISGPGGTAFTPMHGTPNPIAALASALAAIAETPLPPNRATTLNLGTIPWRHKRQLDSRNRSASIDCRSIAPEQLVRLEVAVHRAVEDAVERANEIARGNGVRRNKLLSFAFT